MLYAVFFEFGIRNLYLLFCHTVLGVFWGVHYLVVERKVAARVISATHRLLEWSNVFVIVYVRQVVKVYDSAEFSSQCKVFLWGDVGGKHYLVSFKANFVAHHKFCQRRAVYACALFFENLQKVRIGRSLDRKIFFKSLVPSKSLFEKSCILSYAFFVIDMKRRWVRLGNFFNLLFTYKRYFLYYHYNILRALL